MKTVNIAFSFDNLLYIQAGVCILSLLENAKKDTFFNIFILFDSHDLSVEYRNKIEKQISKFNNLVINWCNVKGAFNSSFEVRNITKATYYRLLLPELLPEIDKIIYSDVDIIFQSDLSNLFEFALISNNLVAGVPIQTVSEKYINKLGLSKTNYINAGFIILNLNQLRIEKKQKIFIEMAAKKFIFQDQDILNIVCKERIELIDEKYNAMPNYPKSDVVVIHYAGVKPWIAFRERCDIWWEYYRKSIFFENKRYLNYYNSENLFDAYSVKFLIKAVFKKLKKRVCCFFT